MDKTTDFSGMTPAQRERFVLLAEECSEVVQAVSKALRHGLEGYHPSDPDKVTNRTHILNEMGDVCAVMMMLMNEHDLPHPPTDKYVYAKIDRLKEYTHHQSWNE